MYTPRYFTVSELVHPEIISAIGETNSLLRLDTLCLMDLDDIRSRWGGPIIINTKIHDSRGLRPPTDPDGAHYSVHKQGKAFDLVPQDGNVEALWRMVYDMARNNQLRAINTLESLDFTPSWVHVASMNTYEKPLIIKP